MDAEVIRDFFKTALHEMAMGGIPKKLIKNTHIPCLGLELIMPQSGKYAEKQYVGEYHQPEQFFI